MNCHDAMPTHAALSSERGAKRRNGANVTALVGSPRAPLWKNTPAMLEVFAKIANERQRQRELFTKGEISFDCASTLPDPNRKLRVLTEEVGEVAQELESLESCSGKRAERCVLEKLERELVQVAAVATAWLESLQKGGR